MKEIFDIYLVMACNYLVDISEESLHSCPLKGEDFFKHAPCQQA